MTDLQPTNPETPLIPEASAAATPEAKPKRVRNRTPKPKAKRAAPNSAALKAAHEEITRLNLELANLNLDMANMNMQYRADIEAMAEAKDKLQKDLESKTSQYESSRKESIERGEEIEQIHLFMDAIPGAPPREVKTENYPYTKNNKAMTRIAGWLATK